MAAEGGEFRGRAPRARTGKCQAQAAKRMAKRATFPWINGQIIAVAEQGSLPILLSTIEGFLPQMNLVNITTALHRLAKFVVNDSVMAETLPQYPLVHALLNLARTALERAAASGGVPSSQALSNITWSMATMQIVDGPLLEAIAGPSIRHVGNFKPFELSSILWAFAKLGTIDASTKPCAAPLFDVAASQIQEHIEDFTFRCLVTTVWAYATARRPSQSLFHATAERMIGMVHTANCQELANTAWAFPTSEVYHHERLFNALAKRAVPRLHDFKPQELSNLIWGFAASGCFHEAVFTSVSITAQTMAQQKELLPQHLANILWAVTRLRPQHPVASTTVLALLPECGRQLSRFKPVEIASASLAAAKVFGPGHMGAAGPPPQVVEFFASSFPKVMPRLQEFSGQSLANVAASFVALRCSSALVILAAVGRVVLCRLKTMEAPVLLHLVRVFSADLHGLESAALLEQACHGVARALFAEAGQRLEHMTTRELQILSKLGTTAMGVQKRSDLSLSDLRQCCFQLGAGRALATATQGFVFEDDFDTMDPEDIEGSSSTGTSTTAPSRSPPGAFCASVIDGFNRAPSEPKHGQRRALALAEALVPEGAQRPALVPDQFQRPRAVEALPPSQSAPATSSSSSGPKEVRSPFKIAPSQPTSRPRPDTSSSVSTAEPVDDESRLRFSTALGPPLDFLPKRIEPSELQAYRLDYQAFRAGQAAGAKGEIAWLDHGEGDSQSPYTQVLKGESKGHGKDRPSRPRSLPRNCPHRVEGFRPEADTSDDMFHPTVAPETEKAFVCAVKNTFIDFVKPPQDPDRATALGPPLDFLPKSIQPQELQAYRIDYQAFRNGEAVGARGEIGNLEGNLYGEVPSWASPRGSRHGSSGGIADDLAVASALPVPSGALPESARDPASCSRSPVMRPQQRAPIDPSASSQAWMLEPLNVDPQPSRMEGSPGDRARLSVKNTFIDVVIEGREDRDDALDALGPPLNFLPEKIATEELQEYRADYQAFRTGQAMGAKGEIGERCLVDRGDSALGVGEVFRGGASGTVEAPRATMGGGDEPGGAQGAQSEWVRRG